MQGDKQSYQNLRNNRSKQYQKLMNYAAKKLPENRSNPLRELAKAHEMGSPRPHTSRVSQHTQSLVASSIDQQSSIIHNVGSGPSAKETHNAPAKETSSLSDLIAMKNKMERISSTSSKAMVVLTEDQYLKRKSTIHSKTSGIRYTDSQMSQKGEKLVSRISSEMPRHNIDFKQSNVVKIANKRADLSEIQDSCYIHPTQSFAVTTQNRLPRMIKSPSPNRTDSMGDHSNTLSSASPSISPRRINNTQSRSQLQQKRGPVSSQGSSLQKFRNPYPQPIYQGSRNLSYSAQSSLQKSNGGSISIDNQNEGGMKSNPNTSKNGSQSHRSNKFMPKVSHRGKESGYERFGKSPPMTMRNSPGSNMLNNSPESRNHGTAEPHYKRRDSASPDHTKLRQPSNESGNTKTTVAATSRAGMLSNIQSKVVSQQDNTMTMAPYQRNVKNTKPRTQRRQRYNPYRDPNFDPDAPEFINEEFLKSQSEVYEISHGFNDNGSYEGSQINPNMKASSANTYPELSNSSQANSDKVVVAQCKMKRQRYVSLPSESQIGGGKAFRESHINNINSERQKNQLRSFASRIKANSLTDIESINSEEETDQNESSTNNFVPRKSQIEDAIKPQPPTQPQTPVNKTEEKQPIDSDTSSDDPEKVNDEDGESNIEKIKRIPFIAVKLKNQGIKPVTYHQEKYTKYCMKLDDWNTRLTNDMHTEEMKAVENYLLKNKIQCIKYNYSLDQEGQINSAYQSFLQLSSGPNDTLTLNISNLKPKKEAEYLLSNDPYEIDQQRKAIARQNLLHTKLRQQAFKMKTMLGGDKAVSDIFMQQYQAEKDPIDEDEFTFDRSDGTCKVKDIQGLIYGGMSSRFWIMRKHINFNCGHQLEDLPFKSWNCITLQLAHRDVDLVIKNEMDLEILLKFLIYNLKTVDGNKNTALKYAQALHNQSFRDYKKQFNREVITKAREHQIVQKNEFNLYRKVFLKYQIMKIRAKISFMALQKCMTVAELILDSIKRTYYEQASFGHQHISFQRLAYQESIFKALQRGEKGVLKMVVGMNNQLLSKFMDPTRKNEIMQKMQKVTVNKKTMISVRKNGVMKSMKINPEKNKAKEDEIQQILKKNECCDIFRNLIFDKEHQIYDQKNYQDFIQYKFQKKSRQILYNKIKMMMDMKIINGLMYIEAARKKIEISKELLILELEQGEEALIYSELSQDHLPYSFRYYDSILRLINSKMQSENRDFYLIKEKLAQIMHENGAHMENQLKNLQSSGGKQVLQHQMIDKKKTLDVNIHKSMHTMDIQRSRYIQIDSEFDANAKIDQEDRLITKFLSMTGYPEKMVEADDCVSKINVMYLHPFEVNKKRLRILMMKKKFLAKQGHLKQLGLMIQLRTKIEDWMVREVENKNIDQVSKHKLIQYYHQETEKIIKKRLIARRQQQIDLINEKCKPSNKFEQIVKFVEESIEKDYSYFNSLGIQETAASQELKLFQKVAKLAKKKKSLRKNHAQLKKAHQSLQSLKSLSKISGHKSSQNISKKSLEIKKQKQPPRPSQFANTSQTEITKNLPIITKDMSKPEEAKIMEESEAQVKQTKTYELVEAPESSNSVSKSNQQSNYWMAKNILDEISESEEQSSSSNEYIHQSKHKRR